jgi:argininosuccinate lyase
VRANIEAALTPDLYATDEAYKLVREQGMPFRDAYCQVGRNIAQLTTPDHDATVKDRTHTGSTGNLQLDSLLYRIGWERTQWVEKQKALHAAWDRLLA